MEPSQYPLLCRAHWAKIKEHANSLNASKSQERGRISEYDLSFKSQISWASSTTTRINGFRLRNKPKTNWSRIRIREESWNLDAEYHQPGDATTFKSILNEYGNDGEVLGLVVGYSGEASSDVCCVAGLVATRLASKHLEYIRTSASIAKAMQTQRIFRAWGNSFARGFARVILDRVRETLDPAPGSRSWVSELDAGAEFSYV
jgi:hypothetical protein